MCIRDRSIAEAKNFVNIREANATLCGVEKHTDSAKDFASTTFPLRFRRFEMPNAMMLRYSNYYSRTTPTH